MNIYLDHAATSPLCDAAKKAILKHIDDFGNPSSSHELGRKSRVLIEEARAKIAKCINAEPEEIYFTSGGSEANTWVLSQYNSVAPLFEHHSAKPDIHLPVHNLRHPVPFCNSGIVDPKLYTGVDHWTIDLISCMYVNNELGTIQPIKELAEIAHDKKMWFHTDAVQAIGHIPVDVKDINCDTLSASGHKFGAPKGIGFLYVKKNGPDLDPLICGGKQELGKRPGTENVLGIISMAVALEDAVEHMYERNKYIKYLRDKLLDRLLQIPDSHLNGSLENRICGNINIRFSGVSGARLVSLCSLYGVYISAGSACNEGISEPSHVLKAIGLSDEDALSSVRITIGYTNTEEEIEQAANIITSLVERIREEDE
jgi:cysteine desulfurase